MTLDISARADDLARPATAAFDQPLVRVLVTGATGYVGGRLVPRLLEAGYAVRCVVRAPAKLRDRSWSAHPRLEIVQGDLSTPDAIRQQLEGCAFAYYLIHSMVTAGKEYAGKDRDMALRFAKAYGRRSGGCATTLSSTRCCSPTASRSGRAAGRR